MFLLPRTALRSASNFFDFMISNIQHRRSGIPHWMANFFKMLKMGYKLKNHAGYSVVIAGIEHLLMVAESQFYPQQRPYRTPLQDNLPLLPKSGSKPSEHPNAIAFIEVNDVRQPNPANNATNANLGPGQQ